MISKLRLNATTLPYNSLNFGTARPVPKPVQNYCTENKFIPVAKTTGVQTDASSATLKPIDIYLAGKNFTDREDYVALDTQGRELGDIKIKFDNEFPQYGRLQNFETGQSIPEHNLKNVYLDYIYTGKAKELNISDVGTRLHQLVVERSREKGFDGRVKLHAAWKSLPFHYKCGFRMVTPWHNPPEETTEVLLRKEFGDKNVIRIDLPNKEGSKLFYNAEAVLRDNLTNRKVVRKITNQTQHEMFLPKENIYALMSRLKSKLGENDRGIELLGSTLRPS